MLLACACSPKVVSSRGEGCDFELFLLQAYEESTECSEEEVRTAGLRSPHSLAAYTVWGGQSQRARYEHCIWTLGYFPGSAVLKWHKVDQQTLRDAVAFPAAVKRQTASNFLCENIFEGFRRTHSMYPVAGRHVAHRSIL